MIDHSLFEGTGLEHLTDFLTSLGIGLLIGLERERSQAAKAGLRTFALVAMFGTLTAVVSLPVLPLLAPVLASGLVLGLGSTLYYWKTLTTGDKPPDARDHQSDRTQDGAGLRRAL